MGHSQRMTVAAMAIENPVEHTQPATADEPVADGLVGPVVLGRITPAKAVTDHEDDAAEHPFVVHPWNAERERIIRPYPPHLLIRQPEQVAHDRPRLPPVNQIEYTLWIPLVGPESRKCW